MPDDIASDLLAAQQLDRAVKLRVRGAHWDEIARECGYPSARAALQAVGEAMEAATLRAETTADQYRDEAQLRLESMLRDALKMSRPERHVTYDENGNEVQQDDRPVRVRAIGEAHKLAVSLAKLQGVDKPQQGEASEAVPTIRIVGVDVSDLA